MKNALIFFYNIEVEKISKIGNNYLFIFENSNFIVKKYNRNIDEAEEIYELSIELRRKYHDCYEIILQKNGKIVFNFNDIPYILMKVPNIENKKINLYDILKIRIIPQKKYYHIDNSNWNLLWQNKIDSIEKHYNETNENIIFFNYDFNYYVGLWENAISMLNINNIYVKKEVCHLRVKSDMDLLTFIDPTNLIIDTKERDISEYLKDYVIKNNYTISDIVNSLEKINLNNNSSILLIIRTLFPTFYFDSLEKEDKVIITNLNRKSYISLIKIILKFYKKNTKIIEWIKKD